MVSCLFRPRASDRGCIICLTHPPSLINLNLTKSIWWRSAIVILLAQLHKNSDKVKPEVNLIIKRNNVLHKKLQINQKIYTIKVERF